MIENRFKIREERFGLRLDLSKLKEYAGPKTARRLVRMHLRSMSMSQERQKEGITQKVRFHYIACRFNADRPGIIFLYAIYPDRRLDNSVDAWYFVKQNGSWVERNEDAPLVFGPETLEYRAFETLSRYSRR